MRRHPDFFQEAGLWVLEVDMRNAIAAARESRCLAMIHAEQGSFLAALIHPLNEFEEVSFRAAKRIVVLVAIEDAHDHRPLVECRPGIGSAKARRFRWRL